MHHGLKKWIKNNLGKTLTVLSCSIFSGKYLFDYFSVVSTIKYIGSGFAWSSWGPNWHIFPWPTQGSSTPGGGLLPSVIGLDKIMLYLGPPLYVGGPMIVVYLIYKMSKRLKNYLDNRKEAESY